MVREVAISGAVLGRVNGVFRVEFGPLDVRFVVKVEVLVLDCEFLDPEREGVR